MVVLSTYAYIVVDLEHVKDIFDKLPCQADVGILLDGSYSVSGRDGTHSAARWDTEKTFVKALANDLQLGENTVHMSVMVFSKDSKIKVKFDQFYDGKQLAAHLDTIGVHGKTTRLDLALVKTENEMFSEDNGARKKGKVPRFLVILTDGQQTYDQPDNLDKNAVNPVPFANHLKTSEDVKIIVVAVPDMKGHMQEDALKDIASSGDYYKLVKGISTLVSNEFVTAVKEETCGPLRPPPECDGTVGDIGFIIDSSYSVGGWDGTGPDGKGWQMELLFVQEFARVFKIKQGGIHLSLGWFSESAEMSIDFNKFTDSQSFIDAVPKTYYEGSITRIDLAMQLASNEMFSAKRGARSNVPKTLIFLTDGSQTYRRQVRAKVEPTQYAKVVRDMGITIISIGVPDSWGRIKNDELVGLAGDSRLTYTKDTFEEIFSNTFMTKIAKISCESKAQRANNQYSGY
jgi:hypothetical protein